MKKIIYFNFLIIVLALQSLSAATINTTDGIAINGYDPVAYFGDKGPTPGKEQITYEWMDATWRFASEENRSKFIADPEHYAPQYGGYCAYGASKRSLAPVDPSAYDVVDGKLYLNFSKKINSRWLSDRDQYIRKGDENWPQLNK